jgi:hypothetical protein
MINEAVILCRNLRQLWQDGGIAFKEGLQNLLFPSGLVYDKKNGAFRTSEINFIITQIARHTGDLCKMKKGLSSLFEPKSPSAVWTGQKPLYINLTLLNLNVLIINYLILFRLK